MARPPASASRIVAPVLTTFSGAVRRDRPPSGLGAWLRHSLPVLGVVLVVMLVTAIAYFVYDSNRRGAAILGNDLITAIDRRVAVQMHSYLSPAQQFLELADAAAAGRGVFGGGRAAQQFAMHALGTITSVTAFSYADPEGNFLFVLRNDKGGFDSKTVDRRAGGLFVTLKKPGITFSIPHFDAEGKLTSVMGVDIELATLCAFLKKLDIGLSGRALIIDRNGRVVAYPSDNWLPADRADAKAPMLDDLGDPVLARAYSRLRVEGYGRQVLYFGDRRIIVSSEPVSMMTDRNWVVLIVVPETDFLGFVSDSAIAALVMSVLVVLVVAGLSGLLAWRNVMAERRASAAAARQQAIETRTRTFVELARASGPTDGAPDEGLETALEAAAADSAAKRVAVWRLNPDRTTLLCEDCFDQTSHDHTSGMELHRDQVPDLFASLGSGTPIDALDASQERQTADLFDTYLKPLHISSVYIVPIIANGRLMGMLTVEDPQRGDHTAAMVGFCDALSVVPALR